MDTPKAILKAAKDIIKDFGDDFKLIGNSDGWDVYVLQLHEDREIGYPFVYLYKDGAVREVTGEDIFDLFRLIDIE